jgi:peptidoglycan/xylan/chitin deacetylase (PgdA/CDA1 family)
MSRLRKLGRDLREAWEVPRDLMMKRYPPFVTGGALPRGHVPVFVFHGVEPVSFERKLRHLKDNGYVTLGADEHFRVLMGARPAPEKAVVLTFDDGRGSLWGVGRPLLEKYGMKGVVFLVPGRTKPAASPDDGEDRLLSWEEIAALAKSGVFEFQSHTHNHARVHTAPRLAGFLTPALQQGYRAFDVPLLRDGSGDLLAHEAPLGMPFYVSQPRTSEATRFLEDPEVGRRCSEEVAAGGGAAFFARAGWHHRLRAHVRRVLGRMETPAERESQLRHELGDAKREIEERLGQPVVHLCYPWHASGPTARRIAAEVGYRTAYQGKVPGVTITAAGGDPLAIARLGEDYVELLPGTGRRRLGDVLKRKWTRRFAPRGVG